MIARTISEEIGSPLTFRNAYPDATFMKVTPDNIEDFLLG